MMDLTPYITDFQKRTEQLSLSQSEFQDKYFVEAAALTPARAYRTILLQIKALLNSIQALSFESKRADVERRKLLKTIETSNDEFEIELAEIDLEELKWQALDREKRMDDDEVRLKRFNERLKQYEQYNTQKFEAEEAFYFENSLARQIAGQRGAKSDVLNVTFDAPRLQAFLDKDISLIDFLKQTEAPNESNRLFCPGNPKPISAPES